MIFEIQIVCINTPQYITVAFATDVLKDTNGGVESPSTKSITSTNIRDDKRVHVFTHMTDIYPVSLTPSLDVRFGSQPWIGCVIRYPSPNHITAFDYGKNRLIRQLPFGNCYI